MPEDQQAADPAQAFEDLRAEVSVLRKAIEALPDALDRNRAPDYSADFGVIGQGMDAIGASLENLQKHPALKMTAQQHGAAIANAGSGLIREAVQKFDHAAQDAERERSRLASTIGTIQTKDQQRLRLLFVAALALALGFIAFPFVMRATPFGLNSATAAVIMNASRWDAGMALMRSGNPDGWAQLTADANLVSSNRDKITDCRTAATKAKKEQRCTITVPVPGP
ncbi:MAG TPA: DUF6118 family protein [Rhizomicrobium sp.]|nr:DUF6118 family protein [Rhizomicrobium sp.]